MLGRGVVTLILCVLWMQPAASDEVWILRGSARLPGCPANRLLVWNADAVLYNAGDQDARVRVLDVSNNGIGAGRDTTVPARQARGVQRTIGDFVLTAPLWITHLEIPNDLLVDGRLEYLYNDCTLRPQPVDALGKWATPVFRQLVPAGQRTVHQGVDLGAQNARVNVGIYNDGTVTATATIDVSRTSCPGERPVSQVLVIPPKTLIQTSIFEPPAQCSEPERTVSGWIAHAVVTVDQPSLSYAVALSNVASPEVTVGFSSGH